MDLVFHHLGVACRDLDAEEQAWTPLGYVRESPAFLQIGARVVVEPVPAVAFDMREIAFVMLRNGSLVEVIQRAA